VGRPNIVDVEHFLDLARSALDRAWLTNNGPLVQELEAQLAERLGVRHCITITNGTLALQIAIRALGLTGEVIVPSFTFVATAHALTWQGITPVFADIDPVTHCIDPDSVRDLITSRTTGIVAVHLWGGAADVAALDAIAQEFGLALLFDAAHAFGSSAGSRLIGSFGDAEVFSFHATKFFNTVEGGAVTTDDDDLAARIRLLRNFGFDGEDSVVSEGVNGKMNELSAAMGLANLPGIDAIVAANRRNHDAYRAGLFEIPGVELLRFDRSGPSNFQYAVALVDDECPRSRDEILSALRRENVLARRYFWPGCHRMEPYRNAARSVPAALPVTEHVTERVLVLPTGPHLDEPDIAAVADIIRTAVTKSS